MTAAADMLLAVPELRVALDAVARASRLAMRVRFPNKEDAVPTAAPMQDGTVWKSDQSPVTGIHAILLLISLT